MKSHKKLLSLMLALSTLICCFANLYVKAAGIDVSNYTYVVDNMTFYKGDTEINSLTDATEVAVDVTRRIAGGDSDRLIISTYSDTGEYIGMYSVTHHIDFAKTSNVKVLLNVPEGKTVGEVRAYMWKSFSDMIPLSNVLSSNNNMIIDPRLEYEKELQTEFTDVSVNDSFADAASFMAYLGIMNGYGDGTFRPTSNLRVADAARLITYMTRGELLASLLEDENLVVDEIPSSIERGYINYCVDSKYLVPDANGYVNYNENITVKDFLILTLNSLGYYTMAKTSGGWPRGYINLATELEFENLTEYNYSDYITRGTAAEILNHAINVPIVTVEGYSYTSSGELIEKFVKQDGKQSQYYQSILTKHFGLYTVEGYVTSTSKDRVSLDTDEVDFGIAVSKPYNQQDISFYNSVLSFDEILAYPDRILYGISAEGTNAADYKGVYATALLRLDKNDDWSLARFTPSNKNIIVTFDKSALDTSEYEDAYGNLMQSNWALTQTASPYLKFFADSTTVSTKYFLDYNVTVYVNGVFVSTGDPIWTYVINGNTDKITLVDTYKTDGKYDTIYVNSYMTGMVDTVSPTGKIIFKNDSIGAGSLTLDAEDNTLDYHIYLDGEEITVDELKKNDVLTIAYDVTAPTVRDSMFYEIYVSRDFMTGKFTGRQAEDYMIKVDSTYYNFTNKAKYEEFSSFATLGDSYNFNLDTFGNIYSWEFDYSSLNWGIAEKFTISSSDDDYKLTIFTDDGTTEQYFFDDNRTRVIMPDGTQLSYTGYALTDAVQNIIYASFPTKSEITNRVIQYKINSATNKISELKFVDCSSGSDYPEEFDDRTYRIGSVRLGYDTKIIDACYYYDGELSTMKVSDLYDGAEYRAYGYGDKVDGVYLFTLLTSTTVSPMNYALVEGFTEGDTLETCYINLYNPKEDCHEQIPFTENSKITTPRSGTFYADEYYILDDFWDEITSIIYDDNSILADITQRVVSYRILYDGAGNKIEDIKFLDYTSLVTKLTAFDSKTNTIGKISLSEDALMIDVSDIENDEIYVFTPQSFTDGRECKAYAYNKNSDGKYPFVLITEADTLNMYKIGIAEKFTLSSTDDEYKLSLVNADGVTEQYYFDSSKADVILPNGEVIDKTTYGPAGLEMAVYDLIYITNGVKQAIENRVIRYKISPITGKITNLEFMPIKANTLAGTNGRLEYSQSNKTIGNISLCDTTKIIDAREYVSNQKLSSASIADLYDGTSYEAYAYGDMENGAYPFVLITMANMSDKAYAIAEGFTTATNISSCTISLYDVNEEYTDAYSFDSSKSKITFSDGTTKYTSDYSSVSNFCQTINSLTNTDVNITNRIVSYRINYDTDCIEELTFLPYSASTVTDTQATARYHYASKTIGDISLTDDALIVDASEDGYMTYNLVSFVNGTECEAYAYDLTSDEKSPLVIVTAIGSMPTVPANWGIAEKFTLSLSDDYYKLTIFTADGTTKAYYFDASKANVTLSSGTIINKITEGSENALTENVRNLIYVDSVSSAKQSIKNRVIQYKISSSGMITDLKFISPSADTLAGINGKEEYNARTNKIGSISLGETTKMIDATEYMINNSLFETNFNSLTDGTYYGAFAYGEKVDNVYPFVIITEGEAAYNKNTRFAVVTEEGFAEEEDESGDIVYSIAALYGDATALIASDDIPTSRLATLKKGDVIYFTTNSRGYVENFDKIFSTGSGIPTQAALTANSLVANNTDYSNLLGITIPTTFNYNFSFDFTTAWTGVPSDAIQVIYGPVIERTNNYITFGEINSDYVTDMNFGVAEFEFAEDVNVYTYDYSLSAKNRLGYSGPAVSAILQSHFYSSDNDTINWTLAQNQEAVTFAFAIVVDCEIVDILAFIPA